ncbi:uncharacterized protein LOC131625068 [Vicia villosa]|uniref:uncharacterized protein LOC131625068 n=1 Tax=Vicia villosa TaxID=3911 RepID=UPI00273B7936|nr:uncharacterized protein LOC131625068 [Vicia villosa]
MNENWIKKEKYQTEKLLELITTEEHIMRQRAKVSWIRLGDGNNAYFHASVKSKQSKMHIQKLCKEDGTVVTSYEDITQEVLQFYGRLMGIAQHNLEAVDIRALRKGKKLSSNQRNMLIDHVTVAEIRDALNSIEDLKAPGVDGYNSKFFKAS